MGLSPEYISVFCRQVEILREPHPFPSNCTDGKAFELEQEGNYTNTVSTAVVLVVLLRSPARPWLCPLWLCCARMAAIVHPCARGGASHDSPRCPVSLQACSLTCLHRQIKERCNCSDQLISDENTTARCSIANREHGQCDRDLLCICTTKSGSVQQGQSRH